MIPTYEQQQNLVKLGYAKVSRNGIYDTFKYSRKVMYDYLWEDLKNQGILECRGHTYDNRNGKLVTIPVTKTFNYMELNTWKDVPLSQKVVAFKKYNGYMVAATKYDGNFVVSTTGSTTSDYAAHAKNLIADDLSSRFTNVYECIADWDKHIVEEKEGLYLLGTRDKVTGRWYPSGKGDDRIDASFGDILELSKTSKLEGWMVYAVNNHGVAIGSNCCKLKTDYYVGKKKLMRMRNVKPIWSNTQSVIDSLPPMWQDVVPAIKDSFSRNEWQLMTDQQRRTFIEELE